MLGGGQESDLTLRQHDTSTVINGFSLLSLYATEVNFWRVGRGHVLHLLFNKTRRADIRSFCLGVQYLGGKELSDAPVPV